LLLPVCTHFEIEKNNYRGCFLKVMKDKNSYFVRKFGGVNCQKFEFVQKVQSEKKREKKPFSPLKTR